METNKILQLAENKEIILLDVREKSEWNEGHIKNAINIPLSEIDIISTNFIDKNIQIYIYCRSGGRASNAQKILNSLGFTNTQNIGGIIQWQENGGKLEV